MTRIARPRVGQGSPAGMFRCGGRGGGRESDLGSSGGCGFGGETEGNEFFRLVSGAREVVIEKNDG